MTQPVPDSTLRTNRLTLRPLAPADAPALFPLFSDPETMRFMPTPAHESAAVTRAELEHDLSLPGAYYWAVTLDSLGEVVAAVHFLGGTALPGLGYIVRRDYWGQGIAVEACSAALDYGFAAIGYDRVELWTNEDNLASQRVAQKLSFRLKGRIAQKYAHQAESHTMLVFGLWAYEWRHQTSHMREEVRFYRAQPVLMVHDLPATVAYYRDKLGFRVDFIYGDPPDHAGVSRGDWTGSMVTLQLTSVPADRAVTPPTSYVYIFVDSKLDALYADYKARGVDVVRAPESFPWGMREFTIRDLNGHILRIGTPG